MPPDGPPHSDEFKGVSMLIIDSGFSEFLGINNAIHLLPALHSPVAWGLKKDEHESMIVAAVRATNKLASLFSHRIYQPKLGYSLEASKHLFCISGTLSTFLLCDRLLRLNKLAGALDLQDLSLPKIEYEFDVKQSSLHFWTQTIENDPFFNQWIINQLLKDVPQLKINIKSSCSEEGLMVPLDLSGRLRQRLIKIKNAQFSEILFKIFYRASTQFKWLISPFKASAIPQHLNAYGECFYKKLFYWPFGRLYNLPSEMPFFSKVALDHDRLINRETFSELNSEIREIFTCFLSDCGGEVCLSENILEAIAPLFISLQSDVAVESVDQGCKWALKTLSPFSTNTFFTGFPAGGILPSLYTFAAKELGKDVVSAQHSAWGGYLGSGPLVTEWLIRGSDYYVTFGWSGEERNLSHWKKAAIKLPSPLLSYFCTLAKNDVPKVQKVNKHVLLATGFLYRYPSIPNSFLKIDYVDRWSQKLGEIIEAITNQGIKVTIVMYNSTIYNLHKAMVGELIERGNGLADTHSNHNFSVRELIFSGNFNDSYDAVVWDLPAGGFSEALSMGVKTFALCDEQMLSILPEGREAINGLKASGILFSTGKEISSSITKMYADQEWFKSESIQSSIETFKSKFCRTSASWDIEWKNFLRALK